MGRSATGQSPLAATVLAALAMAVPCAPLTAQEETRERSGEVIGQVVDARTGTPLAGAFVSLAGSDRGSFTNREGRFQLTGLDVGPHTIAIQQLGYETLLATVEVAISGAALRILMDPDPILLEGLEIVSDRFMQRRRSVAARVIAFGPEDLTNSPHWSVSDFVASHAMTHLFPCEIRFSDVCVRERGQGVGVRVYVDEMPVLSGWTYLQTFAPRDLYMIEVYRGGSHIRVYTHAFMLRAATTRLFPFPLFTPGS